MGEPRLTCSQRGRARCHPNKTQMVAPSLLPVDLIPRDIWRHGSRAGTARKPSIAAGMWRQAESPHARSRVPQRTLTEQNRDASNSPLTTPPPHQPLAPNSAQVPADKAGATLPSPSCASITHITAQCFRIWPSCPPHFTVPAFCPDIT